MDRTEIRQAYADLDAAEADLEPKRNKLHELLREEAKAVEEKIARCRMGQDSFTVYEILFAATARCNCGAGFAYPHGIGPRGQWECSEILLGKAIPSNQPDSKEHSAPLPFQFYEVKSEGQPSAAGQTTRPAGTHIEWEPHCHCKVCGHSYVCERRKPSSDSETRLAGLDCPKCGEKYIKDDGRSNGNIQSRYPNVVVDDEA